MARIEWVKQRLENWALWKERESNDGLGFPSASTFARDPSGGYREAVIPVDSVEASITNDAVTALQFARHHLYVTVCSIYVGNLGVNETARQMGRAVSTIHAQLDQADQALSQWFGERAARRRSFTP